MSKTINNKYIKAIAVFTDNIKGTVKFTEKEDKVKIDINVKGTVKFTEKEDKVKIDINVKGLKPNSLYGFHVHEAGDLTDKCTSMCAHFNPYNKTHGGPKMKTRHVGDLGNIKTDANGDAYYSFYDALIKLKGSKANIIGRGLIIHEDKDDLGLGDFPDSKTTGHAGKRIACAVIGYAKDNFI